MNKIMKIYVLAIIVLLVYLLFLANTKSEELNKEITANQTAFDNYMRNTYGILYEYLEIDKKGTLTNTSIRGYHGDLGYSWIRAYELRTPFMDKPFEVWIDNRTHEIFGDNFYDTLLRDNKFQHLYSEWIKKQVGIDDGNVKFEFTGVYDKPYIEFDKITTLSDDYREIFENTHNLYVWLCEIDSINNLTNDNVLEIAQQVRENYLLNAIQMTKIPTDKKFGGRIRMSSSDNANEKENIYVVDFDINSLDDNSSDMEYRKYD